MARKRPSIPKSISEAVFREFNHKCAICGRHNPQLHHLDGNPSHNDPFNLLPLCPNCHLQDIHNPTGAPDYRKLRLFRRYKDPLILDHRFHPIFERMLCLRDETRFNKPNLFVYRVNELLQFIEELKMGAFYKGKVKMLLEKPYNHYWAKLTGDDVETTEQQIRADPELADRAREYVIERIENLIIEQLRYQDWTPQKEKRNSQDL